MDLALKSRSLPLQHRSAWLYRSILRNLPNILKIYDIENLGYQECRQKIRKRFFEHKDLKDHRVIAMLVEQGYMDLEDTLLVHKQKTHVMMLLDGPVGTDYNRKRLRPNASTEELNQRWIY